MTTSDVNMNGGQTEADDENRQSSVVILTSGFINGTVTGTAVGVDDGQTVRVTIRDRTYEGTVSKGTWSVTIPDAQTLNGFSGEIIATVFDLAGNAGPTASRMVTVDTVAPTVTAVSIDENRNLKVGDEVTAKINVSGATGQMLTLISGTIGGFELGNLTKIDETTYVAKFVVTDGGTDVAQGTDLAVSLRLSDAAGNVSNNYTKATNLGLNLIANGSFEDNFNNWSSNRGAVQTDRVSEGSKGARVGAWVGGSFHAGSVQQSNVVVEADQTYVLSFDLGRYTYAGSSATLEVKILGQDGHQIGGFSRVTTGGHAMHNQSFSFDSNDYSGPVTVRFHSSGRDHFIDNVQLRNTAGTIDANRPIVTAVSIPNTAMGLRDVVTAQIKVSGAEGETLTLLSGSIGGFALSNLTKLDDQNYTATFTITEGATAFAAGVDIPVSLQLSDPAGNVSNHYTRAISQDEDSIRTTRGPNNMVNGSFERGLDGWRNTGDGFVHSTDHSSDGQHSYALNKGGNKAGGTLSQDITVTSGQKYELSFSFARYAEDGGKSATFVAEIIDTNTGERLDSEFRHTSNDMFNKSHRSFTFTAPSENITVRFKTEGANSHLDFAIDNVQLRDVGGLVLHPVALTKAGELGDLSGRSNEFFKGDKVQIITGDFNSDGKDDFITLGEPADSLVFLNNGNGGFARAGALTHLSSVEGWSILSTKTNIIVGDFNGDGVDDFIRQYKADWGWAPPQVFINDGAARFTFSAKILNGDKDFFTFNSAFHGANVNMIVGDFNGDGFDDFIRQEKGSLDNDSSNTANLFINNQNGGFVRTGELGALSGLSDNEQFKGDFTNIIVGDFNGDGYDDFIRQEKGDWSAHDNVATARLFLNNAKDGAGTFRMAGELSTLAGLAGDPFKGHLTTLIVDDFNGDGYDDFAVQKANSTLDLYLSNGNFFKKYIDFRTGSLSVDRGFTNLVTGDWNGDGAADLIRQEKGAWDNDSTNTANVFMSAVDAVAPTVTAVSIPNMAMGLRDVVTAQIKVSGAEGETLTLLSGSIGGLALSNLTKLDDQNYTATFTITEGATAFAAGADIPVSLQLSDPAGNVSNHYTRAISQDEDSIRTTRGPNNMVNGSFERGLDGWRKTGDGFVHSTHHSSDGQHSYALNKGGNKAGGTLSQDLTVTSGQKYELSFSFARYEKDGGKSATFVAEIIDTNTGERLDSYFRNTSNDKFDKLHRSFTFTAPSENITVRFKTEGANSHLDFAIDNVQLRDVGGLALHPVALTKAGELGDLSGRSNEFFKGDNVQIITGDFNGDGNDDFITLGAASDSLVFLNNGNGGFAREGALTELSSAGRSMLSSKTNIIVGDFNGDGVDDFIRQFKADWGGTSPQVFINDGAARFTFSAEIRNGDQDFFTFTSAFHGANVNIIVGDFNGDGFDDFIRQEKGSLDNDSSNTANLFINNTTGGFFRTGELGALSGLSDNEQFKGDFTNIIVGDFNGDGYDDFIRQEKGDWSLSNDDTTARLFLNNANGAGTFRMAGELSTLAGLAGDPFKGHLTTLIVDDFNGDGFDDFAVQNANSTLDLYLSNGNFFKKYSDLRTGSLSVDRGFTNLVTGDWNGDGAADLIRQEKGAWDDNSTNTANVFLSKNLSNDFSRSNRVLSIAEMTEIVNSLRTSVEAQDGETYFDRNEMIHNLNDLQNRFTQLNPERIYTEYDLYEEWIALLGDEVAEELTALLGDVGQIETHEPIDRTDMQYRAAQIVDRFDKLALNTGIFIANNFRGGWSTNPPDTAYKTHVGHFRKDIIYSIQLVENARKLSKVLGELDPEAEPNEFAGWFSVLEAVGGVGWLGVSRAGQLATLIALRQVEKNGFDQLEHVADNGNSAALSRLFADFKNKTLLSGFDRTPIGPVNYTDPSVKTYSSSIADFKESLRRHLLEKQLETIRITIENLKFAQEATFRPTEAWLDNYIVWMNLKPSDKLLNGLSYNWERHPSGQGEIRKFSLPGYGDIVHWANGRIDAHDRYKQELADAKNVFEGHLASIEFAMHATAMPLATVRPIVPDVGRLSPTGAELSIEAVDRLLLENQALLARYDASIQSGFTAAGVAPLVNNQRLETLQELTNDRVQLSASIDLVDRNSNAAKVASNRVSFMNSFGSMTDVAFTGFGQLHDATTGQTTVAGEIAAWGWHIDDITSTMNEIASYRNATKYGKYAQKPLSAIGNLAAVVPNSIALYQSIMLANSKLHENHPQKEAFIFEAVVQGANALIALSSAAMNLTAGFSRAADAAKYLKPAPFIGLASTLAAAIQPLEWARLEATKQRSESYEEIARRENAAYESSADKLAEFFSKMYQIEAAMTGVSTAVGLISGIGTSAVLAGPAGLALSMASAAVTMAIEGIRHLLIQQARSDLASQLEGFQHGGVQGFFNQSLDAGAQGALDAYYETAEMYITSGRFHSVHAFGSTHLRDHDVTLALTSGVGGKLTMSSKPFAGYLNESRLIAGEGWDQTAVDLNHENTNIRLAAGPAGNNNFVSFISPLNHTGEERFSTQSGGKYVDRTTLTIINANGWHIQDAGDQNTTFDLANVVTKGRTSANAQLEHFTMTVEGMGGHDRFLMTEQTGFEGVPLTPNIDGGEGYDVVNYGQVAYLFKGLKVTSRDGDIIVEKVLSSDAPILQGEISTAESEIGKAREYLDYRRVFKGEAGTVLHLSDRLKSIEALAGTKLDDVFDLGGYTAKLLVDGGGGNDVFRLKQGHGALGGSGDDIFMPVGLIENDPKDGKLLAETLEIDGGSGYDIIDFRENQDWAREAFRYGYYYALVNDSFNNDPGAIQYFVPATTSTDPRHSEQSYDLAVASVANEASSSAKISTSFLSFASIEETVWRLKDALGEPAGGEPSIAQHVVLDGIDLAIRSFLNHSTVGDYTGVITFDASDITHNHGLVSFDGNDESNGIIGTAGNDLIVGRDGDDVLEGGGGYNTLMGGNGADTFRFNLRTSFSNDTVALSHSHLRGDSVFDFREETFRDSFVFNVPTRDVRFERVGRLGSDLQITYTGETNLVTNGSFEDIRNGTGPDTIPYGWYLPRGTGGIYYAPNSARVSNGDFAYILDGWSDTPGGWADHAMLKQDVNVKAGVQYTLSWDLGTTIKDYNQRGWFRGDVYDNNSGHRLTDYRADIIAVGYGSGMKTYSKTFTATSDKVRLEFFGDPARPATYAGDFDLDNVKLVPVAQAPSIVTIEDFFTEAYAGYTETDAQQSFTFASNGHEEVLSYKQLRRAATEFDRAKLVKVGELNVLANEGDTDHFIGQNTRVSLKANKLVVGDFNGDGNDDFIRHVEGAWSSWDGGASQKALVYFSKSDGTSRFDRSQDLGTLSGLNNELFTESQNAIIVGDFNGDGFDDFIKQSPGDSGIFMNRGAAGIANRRFDLVGHLEDKFHGTFQKADLGSSKADIIVGDFNGDGRDDFIARHSPVTNDNYASIFFSHSYGKFVKGGDLRALSGNPGAVNEFMWGSTNIIVGDFNGDDYDDFIRQEKGSRIGDVNTVEMFLNTADGSGQFRKAGELHQLANVSAGSFDGNSSKLTVGDFNGDGFDDFMVQTSANVPDLYLSDGFKFRHSNSYYQKPAGQNDIDGVLSDTNFYAGDWNGDGVVDLIRQEKGGWANSPGNTANVYSFSKDHSIPTFRDTTENTNLIKNGSFEDKEYGNAASSQPRDWHKQSGVGGINENASADRKSDGRNSYALGGWSGQAGGHAVEQEVDGLTVGTKYQLSFDYGVWGNTNKNTELQVQILGPSNPRLEHEKWVIYNSKGTSGMTARAFEFTAKSTNIIVKFSDMGGYGAVTTDLDLDNVQLRATKRESDSNHIANGSFEGGYTGSMGNSTPTHWVKTGTGGVVDTHSMLSADAAHAYAIGGYGRGKDGKLSQTIGTLTKGQKYELSFDFGVFLNESSERGALGVTIVDETSGRIYDTFTVLTAGLAEYSTKSFSFIAPSNKITVTFEDRGGYIGNIDLDIDNVKLVAQKADAPRTFGAVTDLSSGKPVQMSYKDPKGPKLSRFDDLGDLSARANDQFQVRDTKILVGDFNGDGYDDFIRQPNSGQAELFENQKNGTFVARNLQALPGLKDFDMSGYSGRIVVGDFNGDGLDDFIRMSRIDPNQNLIKNGSFEDKEYGNAASSQPRDWHKQSGVGGINENASADRKSDGRNSYALGGWSGQAGGHAVEQYVSGLTVGAKYQLSFDYGVWGATNKNTELLVQILGQSNPWPEHDKWIVKNSTPTMGMSAQVFEFTAQSTGIIVKFSDMGGYGAVTTDLDLDNVQLRATNPNPNHILNGSFEGYTGTIGNSTPNEWVKTGTGGVHTQSLRLTDGTHGYSLGGDGNGKDGTLSQHVTTLTKGKKYELSFDLGVSHNTELSGSILEVAIIDESTKEAIKLNGGSNKAHKVKVSDKVSMHKNSFWFEAPESQDITVKFRDLGGYSGDVDLDIDNVSLKEVSEIGQTTVHTSIHPISGGGFEDRGDLGLMGSGKDIVIGNSLFRNEVTNIIVGDFNGDGYDDLIRQEIGAGMDDNDNGSATLYLNAGDLSAPSFRAVGDLAALSGFTHIRRDSDPMRSTINYVKNPSFEAAFTGIGAASIPSEWTKSGHGGVHAGASIARKNEGSNSYALNGYTGDVRTTVENARDVTADDGAASQYERNLVRNLGNGTLSQVVTLEQGMDYELEFFVGTSNNPARGLSTTENNGKKVGHFDHRRPGDISEFDVVVREDGTGKILAQKTIITKYDDDTFGAMAKHYVDFKVGINTAIVVEFSGKMSYQITREQVLSFGASSNDNFLYHQGDFDIDDVAVRRTRVDPFKGEFTNIIAGDFNGDGYDDIIRQEKGAWDDDSNHTAILFLNTADGTGRFERFGDLAKLTGKADGNFGGDKSTLTFEDFNGDGYDDLLVQDAADQPELYLSDGIIFQLDTTYGELSADGKTKLFAGDWDGDGDADLIRQVDNSAEFTDLNLFG